jgi:uroporphyrinogen-III synthase
MRLIVTRPEPDDRRTARALIRLGHEVILSPMLDVVFDAKARIKRAAYQAVLVTSSNAVRALAARTGGPPDRNVPLLAVGDQTALEAKRAGFAEARSAGGNVDDLIELATGEAREGDLAGNLGKLGHNVEVAVLYRTVPRTRLAGVAEAALGEGSVDGILFYSRRSAAAFALALRAGKLAPLGEKLICFCLSHACGEPLQAVTDGEILIAERPDQLALFALIEAAAKRRR